MALKYKDLSEYFRDQILPKTIEKEMEFLFPHVTATNGSMSTPPKEDLTMEKLTAVYDEVLESQKEITNLEFYNNGYQPAFVWKGFSPVGSTNFEFPINVPQVSPPFLPPDLLAALKALKNQTAPPAPKPEPKPYKTYNISPVRKIILDD